MQLQYTTNNFSNAKTQNRTKSPCFFPLKGLKKHAKAPLSNAFALLIVHESVSKKHRSYLI